MAKKHACCSLDPHASEGEGENRPLLASDAGCLAAPTGHARRPLRTRRPQAERHCAGRAGTAGAGARQTLAGARSTGTLEWAHTPTRRTRSQAGAGAAPRSQRPRGEDADVGSQGEGW